MCLETTRKETEKFHRKNKNKKFIWGYKIYCLYKNKLYPPYFLNDDLVEPGIIKSDRSRLSFDKRDLDHCEKIYDCGFFDSIYWKINRGIHLFRSEKYARQNCGIYDKNKVVKVKCFMSEFVAYNEEYETMVFRSIYLSPKEYNKTLREKY